MELSQIVLLNDRYFQLENNGVTRIFMNNKGDSLTFVTLDNGEVVKIPYHAILYWI